MIGAHSQCIVTPESQFKIDCYSDKEKISFNPEEAFTKIQNTKRFEHWNTEISFTASEFNQIKNYSDLLLEIVKKYNINKQHKKTAKIWVDHTPNNVEYVDLLKGLYPNAKFLHIIRDGRAVAAFHKKVTWGRDNVLDMSRYWLKKLVHGFAYEWKYPKDVMTVKYEDLVSNTEVTLKDITIFLNINFEENMLKANGLIVPEYTKHQHQLVGQKADSSRINSWKKSLSDREVEIFEYETKHTLDLLGYPRNFLQPKRVRQHERIFFTFRHGYIKLLKKLGTRQVVPKKRLAMKKLRRSILKLLPDRLFTYLVFMIKLKYIPNFTEPKSLNEKLCYIKLNKTLYKLRCMVADRLKVRDYVLEKSENCNLIKNLWVGIDFTKEIWDDLPQRFVIKANHGSGMVSIVNKDKDQFNDIQKLTTEWLKQDYASRAREWFYADLDKILIVEEFIEFNNDVPPDYKFFCMNGKVTMVEVYLDRFKSSLMNYYDREFNRIDEKFIYKKGYIQKGFNISKPPLYEKAIIIAEELSAEFDFIRVDLYLLDDKIYFGELTNIPASGTGKHRPRDLDFKLGEKLKLF